ncbi:MAG: kelch motif-containing protein [Candidatus Nanopelagicales bacterium]|nr:kelch motif-containing protein [Candidatus Nanopelagicales bacterium]
MAPWRHTSWAGPAVVYDPGTDALIALSVSETHPGETKTYSPATGQWTPRPQKLLPWAYSVDLDRWAPLPPINFPAGLESSAVTHAVLDPTSGQVLFLMEAVGSRTLWAYSPGWRTLRQLSGQVPAGRSGDPTLILDTSARRLVLILWGSAAGIPGETWTFDLFAQRWTNQHAQPPGLHPDQFAASLQESHQKAAFDPISQQMFALVNGLLSRWRTEAAHWDTLVPGDGFPRGGWGWVGPMSRTGHSLAYDPVNRRILVYGGSWQTDEGTIQAGDVWAYDVPTNTWTELVPPTAVDMDGQ